LKGRRAPTLHSAMHGHLGESFPRATGHGLTGQAADAILAAAGQQAASKGPDREGQVWDSMVQAAPGREDPLQAGPLQADSARTAVRTDRRRGQWERAAVRPSTDRREAVRHLIDRVAAVHRSTVQRAAGRPRSVVRQGPVLTSPALKSPVSSGTAGQRPDSIAAEQARPVRLARRVSWRGHLPPAAVSPGQAGHGQAASPSSRAATAGSNPSRADSNARSARAATDRRPLAQNQRPSHPSADQSRAAAVGSSQDRVGENLAAAVPDPENQGAEGRARFLSQGFVGRMRERQPQILRSPPPN
jgi:hypothetical protein